MPARLVFAMTNDISQGNAQGICTVASLQWAKVCLQRRRGVGSYDELGLSEHQLNALMAVLRKLDNNAIAQTEAMGLRTTGDVVAANFLTVHNNTVASPAGICIFWTQIHTMGYRAIGREFEFFDKNEGLYLASSYADIAAQVTDTFTRLAYTGILGMRPVWL